MVILTTSVEQEDVLAGYRDGANAYVRKPVSFSDFAQAVHTIGMFWPLLSEPPPEVIPALQPGERIPGDVVNLASADLGR